MYHKIPYIGHTLVSNRSVDHSDVVGASPVGAAPTTSSFSIWHLASRDLAKTQDSTRIFKGLGFSASYIRDLTVPHISGCFLCYCLPGIDLFLLMGSVTNRLCAHDPHYVKTLSPLICIILINKLTILCIMKAQCLLCMQNWDLILSLFFM